MKVKRWFRDSVRPETDNGESSAKHADIQRELDRFGAELGVVRAELAAIRGERSPWTARLASEISRAAEAAIGQAIENFARALRLSFVARACGRAGSLVRAREAWRCSDGTFMANSEKEAAYEEYDLQEYERHAAGGRARALTALRRKDGTFSNNNATSP
jgi:hypothetical protein